MKIKAFSALLNRFHTHRLPKADLKQELLLKQGREQFKRLVEKGLSVPVVLL